MSDQWPSCRECGRADGHKLGCSQRSGRQAVVPMRGEQPMADDTRAEAERVREFLQTEADWTPFPNQRRAYQRRADAIAALLAEAGDERTVSEEYHDNIVGIMQRQIHELEGMLAKRPALTDTDVREALFAWLLPRLSEGYSTENIYFITDEVMEGFKVAPR